MQNLPKIDELYIKEKLYKYYGNENKVDKEYKSLMKNIYNQSSDINKDIAFYLTELSFNLDYNLEKYKYLKIWYNEYTLVLLKSFNLKQESISKLKIGLMIYENLSNLFKNLISNPKKMFFLEKDDYICIHKLLNKIVNLSYYFWCRKVFKNDFMILSNEITIIEDRHIININNQNIVILPEMIPVMKKIHIYLNDKNKNIKICNCNEFHTNQEVINCIDTNLFFVKNKLKYNKDVIIECCDDILKYEFYKYIKYEIF